MPITAAGLVHDALGVAERVEVPREPVVTDCGEESQGPLPGLDVHATRRELVDLGVEREPRLRVVAHVPPGKKISPPP
jgi:hypothetical protein